MRPINRIDEIPRKPLLSKRRRDYLVGLFAGNFLIVATAAVVAFLVGPNIVTILFAFAGIVLYTTTLTWVMLFILDDY